MPKSRSSKWAFSRGQGEILALLVATVAFAASAYAAAGGTHWEIKGEMSEACTCQVPCGCNFGQGPSPHHYCWSLASFNIVKGHYGNIRLDGQHLVRAHGGASVVWYIDTSATPAQVDALRAIAIKFSGYGPPRLRFARARIVQVIAGKGTSLQIGSKGGFDSDYIIGMDGKNPIIVENMKAWNVQHDIKAKARRLDYSDQYGNHFDMKNVNSNQGEFDWTDQTLHY